MIESEINNPTEMTRDMTLYNLLEYTNAKDSLCMRNFTRGII